MAIDSKWVLPTEFQGAVPKAMSAKTYKDKPKYHFSLNNLVTFRQCFKGMYQRRCTYGSQSRRVLGCILGYLVGSQQNSHV